MHKIKTFQAIILVLLIASFLPINHSVSAASPIPPVDMFQLPWERGQAWVALDGFDDGSFRSTTSSHYYLNGGAVDFAPHIDMIPGENTSNFWVTAAAAGTVYEMSSCHLKIVHANGWTTEYQHLANLQVKIGDVVTQNQRLAVIANGTTQPVCQGSESNIPHLHFSLRPYMIGATFSGWLFNYSWFWNTTTFSKNGVTLGINKPILNDYTGPTPTVTPTLPATTTPDVQATNTAVAQQTQTAAATQTTITQQTSTPAVGATQTAIAQTPTLNVGATQTAMAQTSTPDVGVTQTAMVQTPTPGVGATQTAPAQTSTPDVGATQTALSQTPTPYSGAFVSSSLNPTIINMVDKSTVSVELHNTPLEGYAGTEFTCTYDASSVSLGNLIVTNLFGTDPAVITNSPQAGTLIVAIAGSNQQKAASGIAFTLDATPLSFGQTTINCSARVSTGDSTLTLIPSFGATLLVQGPAPTLTSTPTFTPFPQVTDTPSSTPIPGWLTYTDLTYAFQFMYPPDSQIDAGNTDSFTRIYLPITPGTNLGHKYLEMIVSENANPCQSPLATQSILETSQTVVINGISFLKQTGGDAGAGQIYQWVAFSTQRANICVSFDFILHSSNPGNFATPPPVFDYAAETAVFDQMAATFTWLGVVPTNTPIPSATAIATNTPTLTPTPPPSGMITGQVIALKPVIISVFDSSNNLIASIPATADGGFAVTLSGGTYTVAATASGYLSAQGSFLVTSNFNSTLPTITLHAGDIDNNNVIDQFDALTIGMSYNSDVPLAADLNNDGVINVLDLEQLANSYRQTGPTVWQ